MASQTPHTIVLRKTSLYGNQQKEALAGSAGILPGDLLKIQSNDNVRPFNGAVDANAEPIFATQNPYADPSSGTPGIDTAYGSGNTVFYRQCQEGDEIYAWLGSGARASVTKGGYLVAAGSQQPGDLVAAGTAAATGATVEGVVARSLETIDNSAGTAHVRVKVSVVS